MPFLRALHQTLAIVPVGFNELVMGFGFGWTAPTLEILEGAHSEIPLTIEQSSWIGSLHDFGRIFGPLVSALLLDVWGRKALLASCAFIFCLMWISIIFYKTVWAIYVVRLLFGVAMGVNDVSSSIYLAEVSSPKVRGFFCSVTMVASYAGELFEFIIATYLSFTAVAVINTAIGFLGLLSAFLLVESPQFLLMKGKVSEAQKNYMWLQGTRNCDKINSEFEKIQENIEEETVKKQSYRKLFSDEANRKSLTITLILNLITMTTGFSAVTSYASIAFSPSGVLTSNEFTILFGVMQTLASVFSLFVIEQFNRRTLVLTCYLTSAISHALSALLFLVNDRVTPVKYFSWFIFFTISAYATIYAVLYPVIHIIRGELFPQSIKAFGGSLAIIAHAFMGFVTAKMFLIIASKFGMHSNFLIFAVVSLIGFFYAYFKLPETRGRTLVDIQKSVL